MLSVIGISDIDLDVDLDGNPDFDVGDLISFKGFIHFIMGFSGWLMLNNKVTITSIAIAIFCGLLFVFILYFFYRLCMKCNSEPTRFDNKDLVGYTVEVYLPTSNENEYICILNEPEHRELVCKSSKPATIGEKKIILSYKSGIFNI